MLKICGVFLENIGEIQEKVFSEAESFVSASVFAVYR